MVPFHCWFSCVSGPVPVAPHVCSFLIPLYCSNEGRACAKPEKFLGPDPSFWRNHPCGSRYPEQGGRNMLQ